MPVKSPGPLLAGTATLAGLMIVAGFGCHSSPSDHDSFAIPNRAGPSSGGLLSRRGVAAPPVLPNGAAPAVVPTSAPLLLQPAPAAAAPAGKREIIASTWAPVRRVSAEEPVSVPTSDGPPLDAGETVAPNSNVLPQPRPLPSSPPATVLSTGTAPLAHPPYASVPREFEKMTLPPYVVEPPDILLIQASDRITLRLQPIQGQHLVAPDGTVNLGIYGKVRVAGLTLEQVADAVAARLLEVQPGLLRGLNEVDEKGFEKPGTEGKLLKDFQQNFSSVELIKKEMQVDVLVYNSKFYYVITDGGGYGEQVYPFPIKGNETVLDALANINGLPTVANKRKVWVARATRAGQPPKILPVDWKGVAKCGQSATNYQLFPGDRVYVDSSPLIKADTFLSKLYSPLLRSLGATMMGASTVRFIKLSTIPAYKLSGIGGFIR